MKETEDEEAETKVIYAPTKFYEACDECETLPEERWEDYRHHLEEETKAVIEGRERVRHSRPLLLFDSNLFSGIGRCQTQFQWPIRHGRCLGQSL